MKKAISLGYRSHQTSTCGLHIHVNRDCFGEDRDTQDEVISRILYFVEHHWNEMLKFSRRSEYSMNRWAARYGFEKTGREILDKAKKGNNGRYAAVNLMSWATIEFRLFRGTLKYNTLIAALELVNAICDLAINLSDEGMSKMSWSEFVDTLHEPELIQYLKERKLYVNEDICKRGGYVMKADMKKVIASSAGEIIAVAALVTATVVVDMISERLKEIADEKKKPMIDIILKEDK